MAKELFPNKIIWLASYPKSGNTWFRAFLSALMGGGEVEINSMKTDGIFSSREIFEIITDIDSHDLYDEEVKLMLPSVYRQLAAERKQTQIVKVHDAYSFNKDSEPLIPADVTHCAVYIIRNPLDVVASLANHNGTTIDQAIDLMNNKEGCLAYQRNNLNIASQLRQLMYDWSSHVISWTRVTDFPVYVIRYEDMLGDSLSSFSRVLDAIGWNYSQEKIKTAVDASSFDKLSKQEKEKGFFEKNKKTSRFFRSGSSGNWVNELTEAQAKKILLAHKKVMEQYEYVINL
ncbi:MAG: sulfotransferase domain-containing protein [Sphingobacteriales bacterium]|nr:MAG: sulfotransferase domain-containing protein [Sphingobacteriales bacterium]